MKYKAGDKVRIVNKHVYGMNEAMYKYLGTVMTIKEAYLDQYKMEEDNCHWYWYEDMIEGLVEEDNYLMLNGKKVYLTEEQIKQLGLVEEDKDIFDIKRDEWYFEIKAGYAVDGCWNKVFDTMNNPCDYPYKYKDLAQQIAYDRELHDRLLRYSLNHGGDYMDWSNSNDSKYIIYYEIITDKFRIANVQYCIDFHSVHFNTEKTAEDAIEEVIKPFLAEHPDYTAYKDGFHL